MEVLRREAKLRGYPDAIKSTIAFNDPADPAAGTLQDLCDKAAADVPFVVSFTDLGGAQPIESIPVTRGARFSGLKLYACPARETRG